MSLNLAFIITWEKAFKLYLTLMCVGNESALRWFHSALKEKYDVKANVLNEVNKEVVFLGRGIRWTKEGIEVEADPKHVGILLKEWNMEDCNSCDTPIGNEDVSGEEAIQAGQATMFRRI